MFHFKTNTIIGHRGCNRTKFDNTIEAFLKAIELGADLIEFDIRRTRDDILIVRHDADVFGHCIKENTFANLKKIAKEKGLDVPSLAEALKTLKGKTQLDVELKEPGYEKDVVRLVLQYFKSSEFIIKSFHDESVLAVKKSFPDVTTGLLLGTNDNLAFDAEIKIKSVKIMKRKYSELSPWRRVSSCHADFISPHQKLLMFGLLKNARKRKIPVLVWTVNTRKTMASLWKTGLVSGFITDNPGLAKNLK